MALKKRLTKAEFEELPDALKSEYVKDGAGYRLDLEDEDPDEDPDEDEDEDEDEDPDEDEDEDPDEEADAKKIARLERELRAAKRSGRSVGKLQRELRKIQKDLKRERSARREERYLGAIRDHLSTREVASGHLEDVIARIRRAGLELQEDGTVARVDDDGETLTLEDYVDQLEQKDAPRLFGQPQGSSTVPGGPRRRNPNAETIHNPTRADRVANAEKIAKGEIETSYSRARR